MNEFAWSRSDTESLFGNNQSIQEREECINNMRKLKQFRRIRFHELLGDGGILKPQ